MPGIDLSAELGSRGWVAPDRDRLVAMAQRARLEMVVIGAQRALWEDVAAGNAETAEAVANQPLLRGWVVVTPTQSEASIADLRRYLARGQFLGAWLHARTADDLARDGTQEILGAYRRFARPLLVSCPDFATLQAVEAIARSIPQMKFVLRGAAGDDWAEAIVAAKRTVNLILEPFTGGYHRAKLEAMVAALGEHRIVFATGYPAGNPGAALGLLAEARLADTDKQAILTRNSQRLFGLGRAREE